MRINGFMFLLSLLLGALIFYGFYASGVELAFSLISAISCTILLSGTMGFYVKDASGSTVAFKVLSSIVFVALLLINMYLAWIDVNINITVILNGILVIIWLAIAYSICKSKQ